MAWTYRVDTRRWDRCFKYFADWPSRRITFSHHGSFPALQCSGGAKRDPGLAILQLCQAPAARLSNMTHECLRPADIYHFEGYAAKVPETSAIRTGCFRYVAAAVELGTGWECSFAMPRELLSTGPLDPIPIITDRPWLGHWESRKYRDKRPRAPLGMSLGAPPWLRSPVAFEADGDWGVVAAVGLVTAFVWLANGVSIVALRRQGKTGGLPYIHQYSLIVADMMAAGAGCFYITMEEVKKQGIMSHYQKRVCNSYVLSFILVERASWVQVTMLASAIMCIGISLDRHQSVTGLLSYKLANHKRRALLMNLSAYGLALAIILPTYADSLVWHARPTEGFRTLRLTNASDVGVCCQTLFVHRRSGHVYVAWQDVTQFSIGGALSHCAYRPVATPKRLPMAAMALVVYAALLAANLRFLLAYRRDRQRAAESAAQASATGKKPVSGRRLAVVLGLSSALHLATGASTVTAAVLGNHYWDILPLLGLDGSDRHYVYAMAEILTAFNLVSTFTFYLLISGSFRKVFIDVVRCRK